MYGKGWANPVTRGRDGALKQDPCWADVVTVAGEELPQLPTTTSVQVPRPRVPRTPARQAPGGSVNDPGRGATPDPGFPHRYLLSKSRQRFRRSA